MIPTTYQHLFVNKVQQLIRDVVEPAIASNPLLKIIWVGVKGQAEPMLLSLDQNEDAITAFKDKLRWLLEEEPKPAQTAVEVKNAEVQHDG